MKQEHKYAQILRWIADGEDVQHLVEYKKNGLFWQIGDPDCLLRLIASGCTIDTFRLAPKTIRIGEYDVPEPMRKAPPVGTGYYLMVVAHGGAKKTWDNSQIEFLWLKQGLCHLTREAAELHSKALLSFTEVKS